MKRQRVLQIALIVLTVGWMAFTFVLSNEGGSQSSSLSDGVTKTVQKTFFKEWDSLPGSEYRDHMAGLHFFIRKAAHFSEFLVLGALIAGLLLSFRMSLLPSAVIAFAAGVLYAGSDEFHQHFVSGRSPSAFDLLIDAAGVLFGIAILYAVLYLIRTAKKRIKADVPLES